MEVFIIYPGLNSLKKFENYLLKLQVLYIICFEFLISYSSRVISALYNIFMSSYFIIICVFVLLF